MAAITVTTTSGEVKLDPADIDSLTYRVGDKERTIEGPEVLKMFKSYMLADQTYQMMEDHRKKMAQLDEDHRKSNAEIRRSMFGS